LPPKENRGHPPHQPPPGHVTYNTTVVLVAKRGKNKDGVDQGFRKEKIPKTHGALKPSEKGVARPKKGDPNYSKKEMGRNVEGSHVLYPTIGQGWGNGTGCGEGNGETEKKK